MQIIFLISQQKTYVVGTQKNPETVLLSTQNTCLKLMGKEINAILGAQTVLKNKKITYRICTITSYKRLY